MKLGTSIIIFFLAIIALVFEFVLYLVFGIGAAFSGGSSAILNTAFFFVSLMILTVAAGVLSPICAVVQIIAEKSLDFSKLKDKKQSPLKEWFVKDIGTSLLLILLGLILVGLVVFNIAGKNAVSESINSGTSELSNTPKTPTAPTDDSVAAIPPKERPVVDSIYSDADATNVVSEAKGMANIPSQKMALWTKYSITKGQTTLIMFTPYANAIGTVVGRIEKYDPYTLDDVKLMLSVNNVYTTASDLATSNAFYKWDTSEVRAVIEYDNGTICRGSIDNLDSKVVDYTSDTPYKTSISATFDCFREVRNKQVSFVYVLGNGKASYAVDMSKYK